MLRSIKIPTSEVINHVMVAYEQGLTLEALRRAEEFAPLHHWGGATESAVAARIAVNAGAPRLAMRLSVRAWRTDNAHPAAQLQYGFQLSERRGAVATWRAMRGWNISPQAHAGEHAELLALQARVVTDLRDFPTAEKLLDEAENLAPNEAWIRLQRAHLLERQDRVEQALEVSIAASALHPFPFYRPGVQTTAHLMQLLDRDENAVDLLTRASVSLQSGPVAVQLYGILSNSGRWPEAEVALVQYVQLSPLLEEPLRKWVIAQQARAAYHLGKRAEAASLARGLDDAFHKSFTMNLEAAPCAGERVQLEVSFVRQHFKTCAPATLAALGRFWRMPADHLNLAEAICYDGTPHWQQREWAEQNGWHVREFRVTHESVLTLITRGIPFAISTVEATAAHMQAVVGFDRVRGTVLLRDPGQPYTVEVFATDFFKRYRPFGPHGMVFLPLTERTKLEGVILPDADIHDDSHRLSLCLNMHDREGAERILQTMSDTHGDHALVWETRLVMASYDANVSEQLRCLDRLLELFPNNPARLLQRLGCLRNASRPERLEFLMGICQAGDTDPVLFIELARVLGEDARRASEADHWLKRAMRMRPDDSNAMTVQADLLWMDGSLEEATELYRFAANLESYREHLYQTWFFACRRTRRTQEALAILEDRFKRFGALSEQPGMTLAWAWRELDQPQRARETYAEAARLRPHNGYLLLNAANLEARLRNPSETERLLQAANDKVRRTDWLRTKAEIAEMCLDTAASLQAAREILDIEPLALDAHIRIARALAQLEGTTAALAHLKAACARFQHHYGLQRTLVDWSRDMRAEEAETATRELLRIDPADAWARRELAMILAKAGRHDEALSEAIEAAQIEPHNSYGFSVIGHIHNLRNQPAEARTQFRRAVELSVDNSDALHALLDLPRTDKERKDELTFIESQLIQQVVTGDGLLAFRELAEPVLEAENLLQILLQAHQERPDLWHAWSALVSQFGHLNRLDEALAIAQQASQRFPYMPRIWLDLALVHQWRKEADAEIRAADRAFEMNPAWTRAALALSDALERSDQLEAARKIYERALQHDANDAQLRACYANLLWRLQQTDVAFAEIERAIRLAPGYTWAWNLLQCWATEHGEPERAGDFARVLTEERPGEMRTWLMLVHVLGTQDCMSERLTAVDRALALDARATEAWDLKAELLAIAERFDEAIQATRDGVDACSSDVYVLRGRQAWIEARRRRLPEAVRLMREVLAENGLYIWGWNQLAHWLLEQGAMVEAAAAFEMLQRLRPHDSWVNRQLGLMRLKEGNSEAAKQCFAAALMNSPTDVHAAQLLFDVQIQAADLIGAAETLRVMQVHQPGTNTLTTEILLLLRNNNKQAAHSVLERLCASADPDPGPVEAAADAFSRAGQTAAAVNIFKHAIKSGACNPQTAAAAIGLLVKQRKVRPAVRCFLRLKPGEMQRRAAAPLVRGLAECKAKHSLRWLLWRRRQVLAGDDAAWGQVGYALSNWEWYKQAVLWLADWRTRRDVQPWMLFNLCLGLRQLGRYPEATEVVSYAIRQWEHREGSADLRLFLAIEDALAGEINSAQEHLKQVSIRNNVAYDNDLLALAKALVEFQQTPEAGRVKQFQALRKQLGIRFSDWRMIKVMKDVRRTFRRSGKIFARQGGGWRARLWFGWKLNWPWLLLPLAPALAALAIQPAFLLALLIWRVAHKRD